MGIFLIFGLGCDSRDDPEDRIVEEMIVSSPLSPAPIPSIWDRLVYPTDQKDLLDWQKPGVYQPTSSGKIESALFGSARTTKQGGRLLSSFHEGLDIASLRRDRRSRPLDHIYAVADGTVVYVNTIAGNSSYGRYIVLTHDDPLGEVYTLYAHLATISPGLKKGKSIRAGEILGVMGNSGLLKIPLYRAHLHFEIGLIYNQRFVRWAHSRKMKADHGTYNGWNLVGIDPLAFLRARERQDYFVFSTHLESIPRAFEVVLNVRRVPDYFQRYPMLWNGPDFSQGTIVIGCSENGLPLYGREASRVEKDALGKKKQIIRNVDREVLGRNGRHLISYRRANWQLGPRGERWLSLLTY